MFGRCKKHMWGSWEVIRSGTMKRKYCKVCSHKVLKAATSADRAKVAGRA